MAVYLLVGALWTACVGLQEPGGTSAGRYEALVREYQAQEVAWNQQFGGGKRGDPQELLVLRYREWPAWNYAPRFLQIAEDDPKGPRSTDALLWVVNLAHQVGVGDVQLAPVYGRTLELLAEGNRLDDRRVLEGCRMAARYPCPAMEQFLRAAIERSHNREIRAIASLWLGRLLGQRRALSLDSWLFRPDRDRFQGYVRQRLDPVYTVYIRTTDQEQADAEAKELLEGVIRDYGDVTLPNPTPKAGGQTLAELARAELKSLRKPDAGRPAPEIDGEDEAGHRFRLSDHRGKLVVLIFFWDQDEDCRQHYAALRDLKDRFKDRPFVLLGVECDKDPSRLRNAFIRGEINWRCWRDDGMAGPIVRAWEVDRVPTAFLIDPSGTIRARRTLEVPLRQEVERLLEDQKATRS